MKLKQMRAQTATLGQFVRSWEGSLHRDSNEKVVVFNWGPILLVFPAERRGWRS